jgi:predicted flap endonuclease-1-like 5' DNA nuclease
MTMFVIQSAILLAIAFLLGCILGCLLRGWFGASEPEPAVRVEQPEEKPAAEPMPVAEPVARVVAAAPAAKDDLKRIRGIGKQNEKRLNSHGVTTFAQIASWTEADQKDWGEKLAFPGRIEREEWVRQAKILAGGGETEFSRRVEKGEVPTSQ